MPITATIVPGAVTPTAGTETWASTLATATGVPGRRPVQPAAAVGQPAGHRARGGAMRRDILSSTIDARPGSRPAKNAASGKPSRFDHMGLVARGAGVAGLDPVSCHTIQSAASISRSAAR